VPFLALLRAVFLTCEQCDHLLAGRLAVFIGEQGRRLTWFRETRETIFHISLFVAALHAISQNNDYGCATVYTIQHIK
jgi:hypothetical protein